MSVFKPTDSAIYVYDFQFRGRRYSGATGCATKREAQAVDEALRREVRQQALRPKRDITVMDAASRFHSEVGQYHRVPATTLRHLTWLLDHLGEDSLLSSVTDAEVARLVGIRRKEGVKPATVNRSMVEPLRTLMRRAVDVWGLEVPRVNWKKHRLKEPQERVREATEAEEEALLKALPADYRPPVLFALLTGCRRAEIVGLRWKDVNFPAAEFRVTGKGDRSRTIPMTDEVEAILRSLEGNHPEAVFTFQAQRTRDGRVKGQHYPITVDGFQTAWNRHVRPKMKDFRFHDTRHTAATRLVRATGNLRMVQRLLGHTSVTTTQRYTHVSHDDLRAGMELVARVARRPADSWAAL
ncbi:tyrosine-type recombinase/integrase [Aureimonas altamirensis]|uniref:tyrosine-type recombinase/integrase n=1 Tax=Aureimonas altamirensis TaxID=370622 RepID=UPI0022B63BC6|nr:site-specific integrase [Aureimonas altamirensis]